MTGARTTRRLFGHQVSICIAAAAIALLVFQPPALAVVKIFDGFGDADLDNNGIAAEPNDSDVSGGGDGDVEPYVPLEDEITGEPGGSPVVFPAGTMVNEVTAAENANDVGIKWFSISEWTTTTPKDPRASVHVIDDSAAALPETDPSIGFYHSARGTTSFAEAIDDGLALAVETKGRTNPAAGFFGESIELGDEVGDEVRISFDFRIWYSAPNFNENAMNHVPVIGEFRFGVYQDTDNQLGTDSQKAGPSASVSVNDPRTWGEEHGFFRGDNDFGESPPVGAVDDHGWFVRVPIDDPNTTSFDQLSANIARINEETNEGTTGTNPQIMNGTTDFVADPDDNPGTNPFPLRGIDINKVYNYSLSLKRHNDPDTPDVEGMEGDAIFATITITERATGMQWSFGDYDSVGVAGGGDPDGGFESDSWDYFAMQTAGTSTSDEFDWLIDNFKVELFGSNAGLDGDFNNDGNVDAADYVVWRKNGLSEADYNLWRENFGETSGPGAGGSTYGAVPEPVSAALLVIGGLFVTGTRRRDSDGSSAART
jgi:hypothetical protein